MKHKFPLFSACWWPVVMALLFAAQAAMPQEPSQEEIEAMLDQRHDTSRQIDHIFITQQIEVESAEMVMNQPKDGIYPSVHFAILSTLRLP